MYCNGIQIMTYFCLDSPSFACHVRSSFCADSYKACDECEKLLQASSSHEGGWIGHNVSVFTEHPDRSALQTW